MKEKGFTLIELIVTVGILGIVLAIGGYFIVSAIKDSKEQAVKLTTTSLTDAARLYATEFKNSSAEWYIEYNNNVKTGNEYACTTIGMLIDKGYLSNNLINPDTKEQIDISQYVKISRNATTKVLNSEIILESLECKKYDTVSPSVNFTYSGTKGKNDWYITNVTVGIEPIVGASGVKEYNYYIKSDSNIADVETSDDLSGGILLDSEAKNLQVCVTVTNGIDNVGNEKCSDKVKIDKTKPKNPNIQFNNNYNIVINNSTDNLSETIRYFYSTNGVNYTNGNTVTVTNTTPIYAYAEDEAGNSTISSPIVKNIVVNNAQSGVVTSTTEPTTYKCSRNGIIYATQAAAKSACTYTSYDSLKTKAGATSYYCSLTRSYYTTYSAANNACVDSDSYPGRVMYYCSHNNSYQYSMTCNYSLTDTYKSFTAYCRSNKIQLPVVCTGGDCYTGEKLCASGYTKNYGISSDTCSSTNIYYRGGTYCTSNAYCAIRWWGTCSKNGTRQYYCSHNNTYQTYSICSYRFSGTVTTYTAPNTYYCNSGYTCSGSCTSTSTCSKTLTATVTNVAGTTNYYCSLNSTKYSTSASATQACSNICTTGNLYNGKCYSLS